MKQLIVNADDFGFTRDTNRGIIAAHREGILTATTLMANGDAFEDAVRLAAENRDLDVGCHLVLIGGRSVVSGDPLPTSVPQLLAALARRRLEPAAEFRAQIERIMQSGLRPLHLDTHKHTHLVPAVLEAAARLAEEFAIKWIRRPFDLPLGSTAPLSRRMLAGALRLPDSYFRRVLARHGLSSTDHFAGFALTGHFREDSLTALIPQLPEGVTELMTHPGILGPELMAAPTRLKSSREQELRALTDRRLSGLLQAHGVALTRYRDLPA